MEVKIPATALNQGKGPQVVGEELTKATEFGVNVILGAVLPLTPIDQGIMRGGFQTQVFGAPAGVLGRVYNPIVHALPQEAGAKPHFPPPSSLEGWVRRKLSVAPERVKSVAFLVARAIARRGLPARLFAKRGFDAAKPRVKARYDLALRRIAERLVKP